MDLKAFINQNSFLRIATTLAADKVGQNLPKVRALGDDS